MREPLLICKASMRCLLCASFFLWGVEHALLARANEVPPGPLHTVGSQIVDTSGHSVLLRGAQIECLQLVHPGPLEKQSCERLPEMFQAMHDAWHMNVVRLPISYWLWRDQGSAYLDTVDRAVRAANAAGLFVILDLHEGVHAGLPFKLKPWRLPTQTALAFWQAAATYWRANPYMAFDVFNEPSSPDRFHPTDADWQVWLHGGVSEHGFPLLGMQDLVDAIRATGASQIVLVEGLNFAETFTGIGDHLIRGDNIVYSAHPYAESINGSAAQMEANFGFLQARGLPVLIGEWGVLSNIYFHWRARNCKEIPLEEANARVWRRLDYFSAHHMGWVAYAFMPHHLFVSFDGYAPTRFDTPWTCPLPQDATVGMGEDVLQALNPAVASRSAIK